MKNEFIETIKAVDGKYFHLTYHQNRYLNVLNSFNINSSQNLVSFLDAPKKGTYRCRLRYNLEKIIDVKYFKYEKKDINTLKIVYDDEIDYTYKYSNRKKIENLFLKKQNCDDILIVKNGLITDTSIANIALYDGKWKTPKNPLLKGTTRARYLDEGKVVEEDIKIDDINKYTKIALLNAMIDFDIIRENDVRRCFVK